MWMDAQFSFQLWMGVYAAWACSCVLILLCAGHVYAEEREKSKGQASKAFVVDTEGPSNDCQ